jgi:chorismate lyase/3-hydroxybenzoate synthase
VDGRLSCVFGDPSTVYRPLGVVRYATRREPTDVRAGWPELSVPVARGTADAFVEVWTTGRPVRAGRHGDLGYGHDGEFAFCAGRVRPAARYAAAVRVAYLDAFHLLRDLGYRHLLRMWNYLGGINEPNADGLETYRDFCRGRAEAFDHSPLPSDRMPAGTAVGALRPGIDFYLIARRRDGHVAVENGRQVPAYSYPERYGPRSPSFARAAYLPDGGGMLISGTASILGHETRHAGDVAAQCRTTLANLAALVDPANLARHGIDGTRGDLSGPSTVKVYVRRRRDLAAVRRLCAAAFPPPARVAYLTVDLCRADLLVEIEATVGHQSALASKDSE